MTVYKSAALSKKYFFQKFQFAGLLLAVFIMELTVGICAAVFKTDYKVAFKESLSESLRHVLSSGKDRSNYYDVARDRVSLLMSTSVTVVKCHLSL